MPTAPATASRVCGSSAARTAAYTLRRVGSASRCSAAVAGTWTLLGGAVVSLLAALTGWADWHRSSEPGTQARRTINAHAVTMLTVTALVLVDLAVRALAQPDRASASAGVLVLSILAA